jgi:hypothetical protein
MTTAGMILQDDFATIAARAAGVLNNSQAVLRLPQVTRDTVFGQVQSSLAALHDIDVREALLAAWDASRTLNEAAHRSLATNASQPVHLNGYAIPIDYEPELQVLVDGQTIATVHFQLRITLELFNFDGVVERGRLVRLSSEAFTVTAVLTVEGQTVAHRSVRLDLRYELPVPPDGIPLARAAWRQ